MSSNQELLVEALLKISSGFKDLSDIVSEFLPSNSEEKHVKKTRKKRDPNEPKKPLSSYLLFSQKLRESIQKENPLLKVTEISKIIGEKWQKLSVEEKKTYEDQSKGLWDAFKNNKITSEVSKNDEEDPFSSDLKRKSVPESDSEKIGAPTPSDSEDSVGDSDSENSEISEAPPATPSIKHKKTAAHKVVQNITQSPVVVPKSVVTKVEEKKSHENDLKKKTKKVKKN